MRICIPTQGKEGKHAIAHAHFGNAAFFTIYDVGEDKYEILENTNQHHSHGLCHPLYVLGDMGIDVVVCSGIGSRALQKLKEAEIKVYRGSEDRVEEIIRKYKSGKLELINTDSACHGHGCK